MRYSLDAQPAVLYPCISLYCFLSLILQRCPGCKTVQLIVLVFCLLVYNMWCVSVHQDCRLLYFDQLEGVLSLDSDRLGGVYAGPMLIPVDRFANVAAYAIFVGTKSVLTNSFIFLGRHNICQLELNVHVFGHNLIGTGM